MQTASHSKAVTDTIESAIPLHPYSAIISCPDVSRRIHLSCKRLFNLESMTSESHVISRVNHALTGHSFGAQKSSCISMGASGGAWLVRDQRDARTYTGMKVDVIRSRAQMILSLLHRRHCRLYLSRCKKVFDFGSMSTENHGL